MYHHLKKFNYKYLNSIKILRSNSELLDMYHHPSFLYLLTHNDYKNKILQEEYNKLHEDFKYDSIVFNGLPLPIIFANITFLKYLKFNKSP